MGTRLRHTIVGSQPARHDFSPRAASREMSVSRPRLAFLAQVISFTCNRLFYAF